MLFIIFRNIKGSASLIFTFVFTGHFSRNGIVVAPASAQVMVDILLDRPSNIDLSPYKLAR